MSIWHLWRSIKWSSPAYPPKSSWQQNSTNSCIYPVNTAEKGSRHLCYFCWSSWSEGTTWPDKGTTVYSHQGQEDDSSEVQGCWDSTLQKELSLCFGNWCNHSVLAGKRNFYLCWNNGQQTQRFGLVEEQLMQFCSQGNLRKAENKGLYIVLVK